MDSWAGRERVLGTLMGAMEELTAPGKNPMNAFSELFTGWNRRKMGLDKLMQLVDKAAFELADNRTDDILRTCFAVALYFFQVISSFVTILGGANSSPPAGRIGTAAFMTWIIPIVLLSNTIGGFTSRRSCFHIMQQFACRIPRLGNQGNQGHQGHQANQRNQEDEENDI